jgi:RNA polymerase sigma-70 factor (ECF subfamily)
LVTTVLMLVVLPRARPAPEQAVEVERPVVAIERAGFTTDRFLPPDDPAWPGHWAQLPSAWSDRVMIDGADVLGQARAAIAEMPPALRQVIVLRDLEGRSSDDVGRALEISPEEVRRLLQQARSLVRARLERHLDGAGAMS